MKPTRLILVGTASVVIGIVLLCLTPAQRSPAQVARDAGSAREEKGVAFDRAVTTQCVLYSTLAILGAGAIAFGSHLPPREKKA